MVYIPPGEFIFGSDDVDSHDLAKEFGAMERRFHENEKPLQKIFLKGFYIDKHETTNKEYKKFTASIRYPTPKNWNNRTYEIGRESHPVIFVSWNHAKTYCEWAGKRLPTEREWEKTARGPYGNKYPWGNKFNESNANLDQKDTLPVGSVPQDKSFYGVYDMGGNVIEWTDSWYKPYHGSSMQSDKFGENYKVARGGTGNATGHYRLKSIFSRSTFRSYSRPILKASDIGVRCAKSL